MADTLHGINPPRDRPAGALLISGAGVVGLTLGTGLARAGFAVTVLGPVDTRRNGRTVALLDGSVRMLAALEVWSRVETEAAPLATMRIVDATGSLFRGPPVAFRAAEIGLAAFGYNIENAVLAEALEVAARQTPGLVRDEALFSHTGLAADAREVTTNAGKNYRTDLLIAADGADSPARASAGIGTQAHAYPQTALTMLLAHTAPHDNVSTEFHTREGPFTLVPLRPAPGQPHRSSLVWVMAPAQAERRAALPPDQLAREVEIQSQGLLGTLAIEGRIGRFPIRRMQARTLIGPRLALVGEAAHALPPIGAQGLNLSLRDAATLIDLLGQARSRHLDPGSAAVLADYQRQRAGDIALRAAGVDALNRSLLSPLPPIDALRGFGLSLLAGRPGVRTALMRHGLMPRHAVPTLMR